MLHWKDKLICSNAWRSERMKCTKCNTYLSPNACTRLQENDCLCSTGISCPNSLQYENTDVYYSKIKSHADLLSKFPHTDVPGNCCCLCSKTCWFNSCCCFCKNCTTSGLLSNDLGRKRKHLLTALFLMGIMILMLWNYSDVPLTQDTICLENKTCLN